jgi:outer membrane protein assembly factor BamB
VLGSDGTVYVQTSNTVQALSPKEMKLEQTFSAAFGPTSPVVFGYKDTDLVVTAGKNGSLYLLDAKALDKVVYQTPVIAANADHGLWGGLSTWQGADGTRWVLASVLGGVHGELKPPQTNGDAPNGSIVAFKLTDQGGKLSLAPAWVSRDLLTPQAPVIANGVVFALSAGVYKHKGKPSGHATLYGFDGETGKEVYSTGDQVTAPANLTGLTMANGRVFFSTVDSTLYAFGYHLEY